MERYVATTCDNANDLHISRILQLSIGTHHSNGRENRGRRGDGKVGAAPHVLRLTFGAFISIW